jgi:hypothetical protein
MPYFPERPVLFPNPKFVAGSVYRMPHFRGTKNPIHRETCITTVLTSGGGPYMTWQTRIAYNSFKAVRNIGMRYFVRVLHGAERVGDEDSFPFESFTVNSSGIDNHGFPVFERSYALAKWAVTPSAQRCSHVAMIESDYVFLRPFTERMMPSRGHVNALHFGYINANYEKIRPVVKKYVPPHTNLDAIPQTGNAPAIMHIDDFIPLMQLWWHLTAMLESDDSARAEMGWVRDMYSISIAMHLLNLRAWTPLVPYAPLAVQIPADDVVGEAAIVHYTWGPIISLNGVKLWEFDKRSYDGKSVVPLPPHWQPGMRLQANETVSESLIHLLTLFVNLLNSYNN